MNTHRLPALALFTLLSLCAAASEIHENVARGIQPDKMYHFTEFDQVNLFNGNLSVTIPIGGAHPVSDRLSWSLVLAYNGKSWDHREVTRDGWRTLEYLPTNRSNAGHGWLLTLGRLFSASDTEFNKTAGWLYESPDGAEHRFTNVIHSGYETPTPGVFYTTDGTYLRLKAGPSEYDPVTLEFPDGTVHRFDAYDEGGKVRYRLARVEDAFGNFYRVAYSIQSLPAQEIWTIVDQHGRAGVIRFDIVNGYITRALKSVELPAFGGTAEAPKSVRYDFTTEMVQTYPATCLENAGGTSEPVIVPHLARFSVSPGGDPITYAFTYHPYGGCNSGALATMTLPTGGTVEWDYGTYALPVRSCESAVNETPGVTRRTFRAAGIEATWTYASDTIEDDATVLVRCDPEVKQRTSVVAPHTALTIVTSPTGDQTIHYFAAWSGFEPHPATGHVRQDYGLPFSGIARRGETLPKFLSTRTCDGACTASSVVRETYLRYERDPNRASEQFNLNRRVAGTWTEYYQQGVSAGHEETDSFDFDGVGHYREETKTGSFLGNGGARTTRIDYNVPGPDNPGALDTGTFHPSAPWNFRPPPVNAPWVLNTYSASLTSETGAGSARQEFCFDPRTGFLNAQRTLAGPAPDPSDVVQIFLSDPSRTGGTGGAVTHELTFGGDWNRLMESGSICALSRTTPGITEYDLRHRYSSGVRSESQYFRFGQPMEFKTLDQDIDRNTGLVAVSRDAAGLPTRFTYDGARRITRTEPHNLQPITYTYAMSSASGPAKVAVSQISARGSGEVKQEVEFDPFGRVLLEKRRMADGTWTQRRTQYLGDGNRSAVSEWQTTPQNYTRFEDIDPFGRVRRTVAPDGSVTYHSYEGQHVARHTSFVATGALPTDPESQAVTSEYRDVHGRLYRVIEPGANTTADYDYDVGNRLTSVAMSGGGVVQSRSFQYDNRGFLLREQHPEKGTAGNGWVIYPCYDSRGNVLRKIDAVPLSAHNCSSVSPASRDNGVSDLEFAYDAAARLTRVRERGGFGRLLKEFLYGLSSSAPDCSGSCDWAGGKMKTATRHNWHPYSPQTDTVVTETFTYGGPGGRVSSKSTSIGLAGDGMTPVFVQSYGFDDLGAVTAVDYPECSGGRCLGVTPPRRVEQKYTNGYVTAVPGFTRDGGVGVTYWPNGMTRDLAHRNGVLVSTAITPDGMARPLSITVTGFHDGVPCNPPSITAPPNPRIPYNTATDLTVTATGSGTLTYQWFDAQPGPGSTPIATGATFRTPALTRTTTYWVRVINDCGTSTASSEAAITVTVQLPEPAGVVATHDPSAGKVNIRWSPVAGDVRYTVERSADGTQFTPIASGLTEAAASDTQVSLWSAYLYRVIATSATAAAAEPSAPSAADATAITPWSAASLRGEVIRADHIGSLRRAADALRVLAGLSRSWSSYDFGGGVIYASHFTEVRDALVAARDRLHATHRVPAVSLGVARRLDVIQAAYIDALREATR